MTTTSTCTIRAARPEDGDSMAALAIQLGYPCTGTEVRKRLGDMNDPDRYGVFVAVLPEAEVVGWIGVYFFRAVELDTFAEISGLIVDETARCRGIGKVLLQAAEDWARRVGCNAIGVNSNIVRERAHRFYSRHGYELVKTQRVLRKNL